MNIAVHRDHGAGMSQDLTERFYVKSYLDTSGSKGMPECMEMSICYFTLPVIFIQLSLQQSRLNKRMISGQYKNTFVRTLKFFTESENAIRQRNRSHGTVAFRCPYHNHCFSILRFHGTVPNPLHGIFHRQRMIFK